MTKLRAWSHGARTLLLIPAGLLLLAGAAQLRGSDGVGSGSLPRVRVGASTSLVSAEVNENDARAAIKTWADALSQEAGIKIVYVPEILSTPAQLAQRVRQGEVEAFSAPTPEYSQVISYTDKSLVIVDQSYMTGGEEYLILVHADSGIRTLADLRGHTLIRHTNAVMSLADDWLDTLLAGSNLEPPASFFGQSTSTPKLSRAVLPVYFHQTDACLVHRRGFEIMGEMNPQLRTKLRVVATSPKVIPVVVAVHKDCPQRQKDAFRSVMVRLSDTVAGRQILTLFASRSVMAADASILGPTLELISTANRVRARSASPRR
ncbi:MAG: PhnD/SsuA/transferrin family substrate-binding protein [Acidobacteria bacterium]|nr:PhnD/SsuA/transferrin family substrate-binding protein [Acidobacteriota bacterium]